jgi:hypothetical protein
MAGWKFYLDGNEVEEPIGWDGIEFTAIRMESHGIDQPFSTEVKFYDKGARYIKNIFDQYYINQPIAITITSDVGYSGQDYQFDGYLNLAIYQEHNVCDTDSFEVTVGIIDDNFREDFKARQDVEIDLNAIKDLNGDSIPAVTYDSIRLHKQDVYLVARGANLATTTLNVRYDTNDIVPPWDYLYPDYVQVVPTFWQATDFQEQYGLTRNTQGNNFSNSNIIFINNSTYTRTFTVNVAISGGYVFPGAPGSTRSANVEFFLRTFDNAGLNDTFYYLGDTPVSFQTSTIVFQPFTINSTQTVTIPADYRMLLLCYWGQSGGNTNRNAPDNTVIFEGPFTQLIKIENNCVIMSEINSGDYASFSNALKIENLLNRVIYQLTGSNNKLLSDTFSQASDGCFWNNAITNGVRIRNASTIDQIENGCGDVQDANEYAFKTSFKKLFEHLDKIFCLGWAFEWTGTEWKIRVEPREYFYQNSISQTFNNVGEVDQMAKSEKLINQVFLGYSDKWKNIQTSGVWAIHTDRNYFIGNRAMNEASTASLDLRSDIIAEGYAIEFSRRLQFYDNNSGSSDRPNDYELFIIWLNRYDLEVNDIEDTVFTIPDETGTVTLPAGTVSMPSDYINTSNSPLGGLYNIFHTPARVALRWWKVLGMNTYGLTNPTMRFQVGEYQTTYSSMIADSIEPCQDYCEDCLIQENINIDPADMRPSSSQYLFKPISIQFTYPQSLCDFLTLSQDEQYRKVRLTSGGLDIQGFITEAKNKPEDSAGGTTTFTLLMSAQDALAGGAFNTGFDDGYD